MNGYADWRTDDNIGRRARTGGRASKRVCGGPGRCRREKTNKRRYYTRKYIGLTQQPSRPSGPRAMPRSRAALARVSLIHSADSQFES